MDKTIPLKILQNFAQMNVADKFFQSFLSCVEDGDTSTAQNLLKNPPFDLTDEAFTFVLSKCVEEDAHEVFETVMGFVPSLGSLRFHWNATLPEYVAEKGANECMKVYLKDHPCETPTFRAASMAGQKDVLSTLLRHVDKKGPALDGVILRDAVSRGHFDCVMLLIPYMDPTSKYSAFRTSIENGQPKISAELIKYVKEEMLRDFYIETKRPALANAVSVAAAENRAMKERDSLLSKAKTENAKRNQQGL